MKMGKDEGKSHCPNCGGALFEMESLRGLLLHVRRQAQSHENWDKRCNREPKKITLKWKAWAEKLATIVEEVEPL
jgi:hypothetical protein